MIHPRKATLYGLSEVERCYEYVQIMDELKKNEGDLGRINKLLELVRWSHNGDRAVVDYRKGLEPTQWAQSSQSSLSDDVIDGWVRDGSEGLLDKSGGFERSLPEFDEWADCLDELFKKQAALRVSAAGLGGTVCVHAMRRVAPDLIAWLNNKGATVRVVRPGPSCLTI